MLSHYTRHVFVCTNQKADGKVCCANSGGIEYFEHLKERLLELGAHGPGKIRVSKSGCLGRCSQGPCVVIYPEGVWYTYSSVADIDEIVDKHLLKNKIVEHLLIDK
ncbi:(2Fe-2S) ferredoxin domain-containing protein [Legionella birminghamensis]|uniref:(2Fe-2S) ferredoxin domain-containing protein n=1 Tax=Legionella birminghamensis TaxID=28083 RepID=UPI0015598FB1|nr:(2Fe-2S) ferredoxin domain-containing protein [Legionella birminghamensis]